MPVALMVLMFVAFIPYVLAGVGNYLRVQQLGHLDNQNPRAQAAELKGAGARAVAAQSNAWEALALYSATILAVFASGVSWPELTVPSIIFAATRLVHPVLYIANIAAARSIVVAIGLASCVYMLYLAF